MLVPESIRVTTREDSYVFSMFMNIAETHHLMTQLANIAIRQLLDRESFEEDLSISDRIAAVAGTKRTGKKKKKKVNIIWVVRFVSNVTWETQSFQYFCDFSYFFSHEKATRRFA